jgi:predicted nucleic acid-binding protein
MSRVLLDTSALLTLRSDEPGADRVEVLLLDAGGDAACHGCFITLMELLYRVWKDEGKDAGWAAYQDCRGLPITWLHESQGLLERAASVKATHALSLADAWIAAAALELDATLVHKDPEFESVAELRQERLPYN